MFLDGGFDSPSKLGVMWHFQEGEYDCNVSDDVKKELYKIVTPLLDTLHQELEKQGFVFQPRKKEDEVAYTEEGFELTSDTELDEVRGLKESEGLHGGP